MIAVLSVATPGYNEGYLANQAACKGCGTGNYLPEEVGSQIQYNYWSSTDDPTAAKRVWTVDFKTAAVVYDYKTANQYVRCVRGSMN